MFQHFLEWKMSRSDPRFKAYREARLIYEAYLSENRVQFDELTLQLCTKALQDKQLLKAEQLYKKAVELARDKNSLEDVATGLSQLGMLLHLQGRLNEAEQLFKESIEILTGLPKTNRQQQETLSGGHYHLGIIAYRKSHFEEGTRLLRKSIEIDEANNDIYGKIMGNSALEKCEEFAKSNIENNVQGELYNLANQEVKETSIKSNYSTSSIENTASINISRNTIDNQTENETEIGQSSDNQKIGSFWHDVIWLLSDSTAANDKYIESLENLERHLSNKLVVSRAAFGSKSYDKSTFQTFQSNERLCAAVIVLERNGLQNKHFRYWLNWCIEQVATNDDFRLFVYLDDLNTEEIKKQSREGDNLLATLLDTVQISETFSPGHLHDSLKLFLQGLDDIRSESSLA